MTKKKIKRFPGNLWFQARVRELTIEALNKKESQFAAEHSGDSDEALLSYVRTFSKELGRTPNASEIIGGAWIAQRFGSWNAVAEAAGLSRPRKAAQLEHRLIYKQTYREMEIQFKKARAAEKSRRKTLLQEKAQQKAENLDAVQKRDEAWWQANRTLTDDALLDYIRQQSGQLGHSPVSAEVEGGRCIARHFGSWPLVLELAGLELPKGMQPPKEHIRKEYQRKRQKP